MITAPRLGPITRTQLQEALHRFDLGTLQRVSPVRAGMGGQNLFVRSTCGEYVLRGNPLFPGQFAKERFFADLLHAGTVVPVPHPYLYDPLTDIFGWSYAIMPRFAGVSLADPDVDASLTENDLTALVRLLSETLVQLHRVTWPHPGEYAPQANTVVPFPDGVSAWEAEKVRARLSWAGHRTGRISAEDVAWVEETLARGQRAIDAAFVPTVVLHDYQVGNMLFLREGEQWRVTGVFDLAEAYVGDPESDLARMTVALLRTGNIELARLFVQHYLGLRPARPGLAERLVTYALDFLIIEWGLDARQQDVPFRSWADGRLRFIPEVTTTG